MSIQIGASLLGANLLSLESNLQKAKEAAVDYLHIDVMDGQFVPNFALGTSLVSSLRKETDFFLDVHLMIYSPFSHIEKFAEAGAHRISFHVEATENIDETLNFVTSCGLEVGLALSPGSSPSTLFKYFERCDRILLMGVKPGFGGQTFLPQVLDSLRECRDICQRFCSKGKAPGLQVDGGIDEKTAALCREAGADDLISGSYLFADCSKERVARLRGK